MHADHPDDPRGGEPSAAARGHLSRRHFLGAGGALIALAGCTARHGRPSADGRPSTSPAASTGLPSASPRRVSSSSAATRSAEPTATRGPSAPATAGAQAHGPAREVRRGAGVRPEVALTFHGAGDPALATAIIDSAGSAHAAVTVMAVGTWLAQNPLVGKRILAAGHELGNHTWTHPVLRDLARAGARTEIERCRDELTRLTGSPGRWFRQSGSQHSTALIRELAGAAGYPVCLSYDVDSMDWTDPGPAAIVRNVRAARAGSIVSLHLGHRGTLEALPAITRSLRARGLRAVTVTTLLAA